MREKLGNLESSYIKLEEIETLLILMASGYFDQNTVDKSNEKDILKLVWNYNTYQNVLSTSIRLLYSEINSIKDNINGLYGDLEERGQWEGID